VLDNKVKILIVDDDAQIRQLLRLTFSRQHNYEVHEASEGTQALELFNNIQPNIIFLDVSMPGQVSGLNVCETVKNASKDCVVVLLSGASDSEDIESGIAAGADRYLTKPFSPIGILETVKNFEAKHAPTVVYQPPEPISFPKPNAVESQYEDLKGFDRERLQILELMLGSEDQVRLSIKKFMTDFEPVIAKITTLLGEQKYIEACKELHGLKGSAGNLGATTLSKNASHIETLLKNNENVEIPLNTLLHEWHQLKGVVS
jgi:DNA-binding response OmpR family regulator